MSQIEKTISNLITSHFPFFVQEEGPLFVEFAKKYYEWMEQNTDSYSSSIGNPVYHSRCIPEYKDIDTTVDQFLLYFKEKYLKNIQFNTAASTRKMVKHSLDLYRSKGTPRAIDLLFKVVFDTPAEVYTPSKDLFKLSSGDWYEQVYLEVTPSPSNIFYVGKQIVGLQSGTTAFVEKLTRKKIKNVYVEVFTISLTTEGSHFVTGETIKTASQTSITHNPKIIGSLTSVTVVTGSNDFAVGDIVKITSGQGIGAKGLVTEVSQITGKVNFYLIDGGFGYTKDADVLISEKVFRLSNVVTSNTQYTTDSYFNTFDNIYSEQGQVSYINATGDLTIGANLYTYSGGVQTGKAIIQGITGNTQSGNLYLSIISGTMHSNNYYTEGNVVTANVGTVPYINQSASANVIGTRDLIKIHYSNSTPFKVGENIFQYSDTGLEVASGYVSNSEIIVLSSNTGTLSVSNVHGIFLNDRQIIGDTSNNYADVDSIDVEVGVVLATPATFSRVATTIAGSNVSLSTTTIGIAPAAAVEVSNNSFIRTGASSTGNVVTLSSTTGIIAGSPIVITAGTGTLATNTYVSTITGSGTLTLTNIPTTPLSNASVRVWPSLGQFSETTYVDGIINTHAIILSAAPSIPLANATLIFSPAKFQFYSNTGNFITASSWYDGNTYSNATISSISKGYLASFNVANTLSYPETLMINTDFVLPYLSVPLNSTDYGINETVIANATNSEVLADILNYGEKTIGGITSLIGIDQGAEYNVPPIVVINEQVISVYDKRDIIVFYINPDRNFAIGELVIQENGARGRVEAANSVALSIRLLNFENEFSTNHTIFGTSSACTADVTGITVDRKTKPMGLNAVVTANVVSEYGSVTSMQVIDSGFGYVNKELGQFVSEDGLRAGTIVTNLATRSEMDETKRGREGKAQGYYRTKNGFLSSSKKIHDGEYYQEFSYEVRSAVTLDKYEAMLKQLLHVAGTKYFAATIIASDIPVQTTINSTVEIN